MNEVTKNMLTILSIDPDAKLCLSQHTGGWYVQSTLSKRDNGVQTGLTSHESSPENAINVFFGKLVEVKAPAVLYTYPSCRYLRWNGAAFADVEGPNGRGWV